MKAYKMQDIEKVYHDDPEVECWPSELVEEILKSKQYFDYSKEMDEAYDREYAAIEKEFEKQELADYENNYTGKHECRYCGMNSTTHYQGDIWYCHSCNKKFEV